MRMVVVLVLCAACWRSPPPRNDQLPPPMPDRALGSDERPPAANAQGFAQPPPGTTGTMGTVVATTPAAGLPTVGPDCHTCPPTAPACPLGECSDGAHIEGCGDCVKYANGQCGFAMLSCPAANPARQCKASDCSLPVPSAWICPDGKTVAEYTCVATASGTCGTTLLPCRGAARQPPPPPRPPPVVRPPAPPPKAHACDPLPSDKVLMTWKVEDWCDPCCGAEPPPQREIKKLSDGTRILELPTRCMRVKYRVCSRNKCLPPGARIATPFGDVAVSELRVGDAIWTRDESGARVAGVVVRVSSTNVDSEHHVARVVLADGRTLVASPQHPALDGTQVGALQIGDAYDGSTIASIELVPYAKPRTYDVLPSGSGVYWSDGVPVRSTLE